MDDSDKFDIELHEDHMRFIFSDGTYEDLPHAHISNWSPDNPLNFSFRVDKDAFGRYRLYLEG